MSSDSKRFAYVCGAVIIAAALTMRADGSRRAVARSGGGGRDTSPPVDLIAAPAVVAHDPHELWVCADPNNLPFSNAREEGFENELGRLIAREMGKKLRYFWQPQRRGFIRTTLRAGNCDVVIGVPSTFGPVDRTRAYYRSTYVFVSRADRQLRLQSFDDPRLRRWLVGVQITGEDYENPPPAQALALRHLADNVRGFTVYGDYSRPDPQRAIIDAVADGRLDTAAVWGPLAGYFGPRSPVALDITPVSPPVDRSSVPFTFDISMGVRHGADALRDELDRIIERCRPEIRVILQRYGVPVVAAAAARHGRRAASSSTS